MKVQKTKYRLPEKAKILIAMWIVSAIAGAITVLAVQWICKMIVRGAEKQNAEVYAEEQAYEDARESEFRANLRWLARREDLLKDVPTKQSMGAFASVAKAESPVEETTAEIATEAPTEEPTAEPTATPEPTEEPTPEVITMVMMATAYSSAPEENGGYGAVDCVYGNNLPKNAIAANLKVLPYGTRVYIEGLGERVVVDTASRATIKKVEAMAAERGADGWIDIYVGDDVQGACDWGIRLVKLTVLEWGTGK